MDFFVAVRDFTTVLATGGASVTGTGSSASTGGTSEVDAVGKIVSIDDALAESPGPSSTGGMAGSGKAVVSMVAKGGAAKASGVATESAVAGGALEGDKGVGSAGICVDSSTAAGAAVAAGSSAAGGGDWAGHCGMIGHSQNGVGKGIGWGIG